MENNLHTVFLPLCQNKAERNKGATGLVEHANQSSETAKGLSERVSYS